MSNSNATLSKGRKSIGVSSYGDQALGLVSLLDFQLFNFSGHFRATQTLTFDSVWLLIQKKIYRLISDLITLSPFIA